MSYYHESLTNFYKGLEIADILNKESPDPVLLGEAFLENELDLRTHLPGHTLPFYAALTAEVVSKLGSGIFFRKDFDEKGLSNHEIVHLIRNGFDGNFAQALVHMALFRHLKLTETSDEIIDNINQHLIKAEKHLRYSQASDEIKSRTKLIFYKLSELTTLNLITGNTEDKPAEFLRTPQENAAIIKEVSSKTIQETIKKAEKLGSLEEIISSETLELFADYLITDYIESFILNSQTSPKKE